jgi:hypothetical protein
VKHIALDSDGVIWDFDEMVKAHTGRLPKEIGDDAEMWRLIDAIPTFWDDIPLMPDAHDLWDFVKHHDVIVITGCPKTHFDRAAVAKKRKWFKHFGVPEHRVHCCFSRNKPSHMRVQGEVLVDDMTRNLKRWIAAGGRGVHHHSAHQSIAELRHLGF